MSHMQPIPAAVLNVFQDMDTKHQHTLLNIRALIFEVAQNDPRIGLIEEALRWGEPAYITTQKKTGSPIRLSIDKASCLPALFFNCKTSLVEGFRAQFGGSLRFVKNRAIILDGEGDQYKAALVICIAAALSYHLRDQSAGHCAGH